MIIPTALYNAPSTALVGLLAALGITGVAAIALWQSGTVGVQQRLKTVLSAIVLGITGITMLATTAHLALVQIDFAEKTKDDRIPSSLPETSLVALWAHLAVVVVLIVTLVIALQKRKAIGTAGAALLLAVSLATYADLGEYRVFQDSWALGITLGWFAVIVTFIAFVATVATVQIRAYGQRQFVRGQAAKIDTIAASQTSVSV